MQIAAIDSAAAMASRASEHVPEAVSKLLHDQGLHVSAGLPRTTWNGMTNEVFTVGSHSGTPRYVHLLEPGVHPAAAGAAQLQFAWNDQRAALWNRMTDAMRQLRDTYGVRYVLGAGSYFSTDWAHPGDIDLVALNSAAHDVLLSAARDSHANAGRMLNEFARFNAAQGESGVHVYPAWEGVFPGGPRITTMFTQAPPHPRPPSFEFHNRGPAAGVVLLDVDEVLAHAGG